MVRECVVSYKKGSEIPSIPITSSKDFFNWASQHLDFNGPNERIYAVSLNTKNKIIGYTLIGIGGINYSILDIPSVVRFALLSSAAGLILSHNHPSGDATPSKEDINITKQAKEACKIVQIKLFDHIIITDESYYSFLDAGVMYE